MVVTSLQSEENHQSVTEYRVALEVLNLTGSDWHVQMLLVSDLPLPICQALISAPVKAYYFMTYPEPTKKPVLNDVMMKIKKAIQRKSMPFAVVVGDQPVYTTC